jgi:hypothetical protein
LGYFDQWSLPDATQLFDRRHRQHLHDWHSEIHSDNEELDDQTIDDIQDLTRQRTDLIRQIIRFRRRSRWRENPGHSYDFNGTEEDARLRSILSLERKKFRFENWFGRQQIAAQLDLLFHSCVMHNIDLRDCVYKDEEDFPFCLEDEAQTLQMKAERVSGKKARRK